MTSKSKKIKSLLTNSSILSLPGFVSIFLSILSIPIHLKFAGVENYGDYLLFHILLSLSVILNFGISKSVVISSNFEKRNLTKISYDALKYSFYIIIGIIIFYFLFYLLISKAFSEYISLELLFVGLIISIIYITLEGILQANKLFKVISVINFVFYSISLSFPSILLIFVNELSLFQLIFLSVVIKTITILFLFLYFIKKKLVVKNNNHFFLKYLKKNSPWLALNGSFIQLYEMMDKYLIKIFMGAFSVAIYSIPQQLTGKLSIISKAFSAFLLPNLNNKKKLDEFLYSLDIFIKYIPILLFILFPLYPIILKFWLGNEYSFLILNLTKIFSLVAIYSSVSHILITKYEADQKSKKNFRIELSLLPFFLIILWYLFINDSSLLFISLLILIKELSLVILRLYYLSSKEIKIKKYLIYLLIFPLLLILSFINMDFFYILIIILSIVTVINVKQHI